MLEEVYNVPGGSVRGIVLEILVPVPQALVDVHFRLEWIIIVSGDTNFDGRRYAT